MGPNKQRRKTARRKARQRAQGKPQQARSFYQTKRPLFTPVDSLNYPIFKPFTLTAPSAPKPPK
jgi:hypothetical protein